jgi:uncharacterized protein (TIGR00730 family)
MSGGAVNVFCGSAPGRDPAHAAAARDLGIGIARRGWTLVYGGGRVGLMGVLADAALAAGGRVIGVIPRFLCTREVGHDKLTSLEVVETFAQRKQRMGDLADAFVSLPGGVGTLDELFEAWSWSQVGLQSKPSLLLNVAGYYDPLVAQLERAVEAGFLREQHRRLLTVATRVDVLLDILAAILGNAESRPGATGGQDGHRP